MFLIFTTTGWAKELSVAVGWTKSPYVIEATDSGYEIELIRHIFDTMGHQVSFVYVPYGRSYDLVKAGSVDAAMTLNANIDVSPAHLSDVYIEYQNVAVSLTKLGVHLEDISDLKDLTIVGFQNASKVLGEQYLNATKLSPTYIELPDQIRQVKMLYENKTQVVVMDVNIFIHISESLSTSSTLPDVSIHDVFPRTGYRMGFLDAELSNQFNQALAAYKQSESFAKLLKKYALYRLH